MDHLSKDKLNADIPAEHNLRAAIPHLPTAASDEVFDGDGLAAAS